ncbi:MAG: DUF2726 domain-containing protein [Lentisphaeria bacterium]|nr:DUF2726 domain-containing protein [Lentisphaeria bacterium]NQZ66667.1 DUF2726 domain-containing protein [Lentisphaeria bacterium]
MGDWTGNWLFILTAVVLGTCFVIWLYKSKKPYLPYEKHESILTRSELVFYQVLKEAVAPYSFDIMCKIRMADFVTVESGAEEWRAHFNKIQAKHVDFLLVDNDTMEPLIVVELDDASHKRPDRMERDKFVDSVMAHCGIGILHIAVSKEYESDVISEQIHQLMKKLKI